MKNKWIIVNLLASLLLIFSACSDSSGGDNTAKAYEPEDILETDVCEVCGMAVPNNEHATQIVLKSDRSLKFDDLGCLYKWRSENDVDEIGAQYVRDFNTLEWIEIEDATFVYHEEIMTPMAYGVISFKNKADAEAYIDEFDKGQLLTAADLDNHEWKMNKEMMQHHHDHDHDHDHDDDDHDHDHDDAHDHDHDDEHNHDEHDDE